MNDFLQQLLSVGPGLGAGLTGNGPGMNAFMDGYQRTMALLEEQRRRRDEDKLQAENAAYMRTDRDRQNARADEDQEWERQQRMISAGQALSGAGAEAQSLPQAEAAVDSLYQMFSPQLQEKTAGVRDASMRAAAAGASERQKNELIKWVRTELPESRFVKDHPNEDIDLTQPLSSKYPRIYQLATSVLGQETITKNDLMGVAGMLEQAPPQRAGGNPNKEALALAAAQGDPARALELLEPKEKPQTPAKTRYRPMMNAQGEYQDWPEDKPAPRGWKPYKEPTAATAEQERSSKEAVDTAREVQRIATSLLKHQGMPRAFGVFDSRVPTLRQTTADAEGLRDSLTSLLTLENTGKLKGVLSNADMEILRKASSTIHPRMGDAAAAAELRRLVEVMSKVTGEMPEGAEQGVSDPLGIRKGGG